MKLYDFDAKFYEYVRTWMAIHPGIKEDEVEQKYNEMMLSWLNAPAQWLGGEKPGEYFNRYSDPRDLIKLLEEYLKRDMGLPEPLYSRIVALGEACAPALARIAADEDRPEALRGTAIAMLRDMDSSLPRDLYIDLVCNAQAYDELGEMAADVLRDSDESVVDALLSRYDGATEYGQMTILDICSRFPPRDQVFERLVYKLDNSPENTGFYAALLGDYGDPRALEALMRAHGRADLEYLDYIEVRNAIEALGGDPGEERVFNGDDAYEALRGMD